MDFDPRRVKRIEWGLPTKLTLYFSETELVRLYGAQARRIAAELMEREW